MLFFDVSTAFNSLFLFFYFSSILFTKFFLSIFRKSTPQRINGCETPPEDEKLVFPTDEVLEKDLIADVIDGGESLLFLPCRSARQDSPLDEDGKYQDDPQTAEMSTVEHVSDYVYASESEGDTKDGPTEKPEMEETEEQSMQTPESELLPYHEILISQNKIDTPNDHLDPPQEDTQFSQDEKFFVMPIEPKRAKIQDAKFSQDGKFLVVPIDTEKAEIQDSEDEGEEILASSYAGGSISNSSCDWRSSTNFRDSETEEPFSSSSRRSSSRWESYTLYKKYDEEMMFLDRVCAQKLTETESLKFVQTYPRPISQRIARKLSMKSREFPEYLKSPYRVLEIAYVAQICLTWEALDCNYKNFQSLKASAGDKDPACPGYIAQQFQQFQVLLQRFIENEPYEHGRRPEVYARMRIKTPMLLQVPEFRGSEAYPSKEYKNTKIPSSEFLIVLEDAIRTFMNFLRADKQNHWQALQSRLKKNQSAVDPKLLHSIKKANDNKKRRLKDLRRSQKCFRKRILKQEEEMDLLMALIDLNLVSRVLRMSEMSEEQLEWCEKKISKVRVWDGKLQRDSSPEVLLFFPCTLTHL